MTMKTLFVCLWLCLVGSAALAQTTAFTYQGKLTDAGNPANGTYDLQFRLFDAAVGGLLIGAPLVREDVVVANGIFSVTLDFGATAFPGANRFLEIGVRPGISVGAFTQLSPLQPLTSTPYAIKSLNAAAADGLSVGCVNCVTSSQIGSLPANSGNYVQNTTTPQVTSNFNISGNGTAGGTLSSNIVNATTQFNLGGNRILSNGGSNNLFAGLQAGAATTGADNAFFGADAGVSNTTGNKNAYFGREAGRDSTGHDNVYLGYRAGVTGTGIYNVFVGRTAGHANLNGSSNTFVGATAGENNTTGNFNTFVGTSAGGGPCTLAPCAVTLTGSENSFFGAGAGFSNTAGGKNTFIGYIAGEANLTGADNSFVGHSAGVSNTGSRNTFVGSATGSANTAGNDNVMFGLSAGRLNTSGSNNAFFGTQAGAANTTGSNNTIIGGGANVAINNLTNATAIGYNAIVSQSNALILGNNANVGIGTSTPASKLTVVGLIETTTGGVKFPDGTTQLTAATTASNAILNQTTLQASANFNISGNGSAGGTLSANQVSATTQYNLGGNRILSNGGSNNLFAGVQAGAANTTGEDNTYLGTNAGQANMIGSRNSFVGHNAGALNTTDDNSFFGNSAGENTTTGDRNAFFGILAGLNNTTGCCNAFFGNKAGMGNTIGRGNVFIGGSAGRSNTTGALNSILGDSAGLILESGTNNVFVGYASGYSVTGASSFNTFLGSLANGPADITNATAVGAQVQLTQSNTLILGNNANVGIGTSAPALPFQVQHATDGYEARFGQSASIHLDVSGNQLTTFNGVGGAAPLYLNYSSAGDISLAEGGGNVGVGTSAPGSRLTVVGRIESTTGGIKFPDGTTQLTAATSGPNTILNQTTPQASANFNIAGNGTVGGTLTAATAQVSGNGFVLGNFGIGTAAPKAKLDVTGGNILINTAGQGFILKSPDGNTCRLLTVDNVGGIVLTVIACP